MVLGGQDLPVITPTFGPGHPGCPKSSRQVSLLLRIHQETRGAPVPRGTVGHGAVGHRAVVHHAVANEDLPADGDQ